MPFVILPTNSASGGYDITNSLRFNSGSTDYLNRTFSTSGTNNKIQTISCWVKRSKLSTSQVIIGGDAGAANQSRLVFLASDTLNCRLGGAAANDNTTTAVFRDVSAWYHIVAKIDTTQATAANRVKIYVNGVEQTIASPTSTLNQTTAFANASSLNAIGQVGSFGSDYFDGYMSEFYFIDGQALTPSSFGETDFDTGIWKPKAYTGTYGTNGFYLQFKNSASLGTDSSGNGNTFTVNNLTSVDQSTDTPTNNFATLNPIASQAGSGVSSAVNTFTEGNLKVADLASDTAISNFGVSTGKWFWEVQVVTDQDGIAIGACNEGFHLNAELGYNSPASQSNGKVFGYYGSGSKFTTIGDGSQFSSYGSAIAVNDIIGVALNLDSNEVTFYKNGSSQGTFSITALGSGENYFPAIGNWSASAVVVNYNFGSPNYSANSYTDGAGYGNFSYSVPSGYYALCTRNLAQYG
jgi:hypothetical protein